MNEHCALAYSMHEGAGQDVEPCLDHGRISRAVALALLEQHYMLCDRIPLEEFETGKPDEVLSFFMRESRTTSWHRRHMRPLGHMDVVALGYDMYVILDTALAASRGVYGDLRIAGGIYIGVKII